MICPANHLAWLLAKLKITATKWLTQKKLNNNKSKLLTNTKTNLMKLKSAFYIMRPQNRQHLVYSSRGPDGAH